MNRQKLTDLIKRRDVVNAHVERVRGRKEAAQHRVDELEERCRARGIDPNQLDPAIEKLKSTYESMLSEAERDIAQAEKDIAPYLEAIA